ncbi:MAG TPA: TraR/DksA family transcriptional regulator [Acidisarcina sp.]|nr:TraR/DksA family transcriptional regulator [Acidisarcina sp.]
MPTPPRSLQKFETRLRQQAETLENAALLLLAQGREVQPLITPDMADQAVLSYEKEMLFSQGTQGRSHLMLVQKALDRIANGTFGDCVNCGKAIGQKRLEALPWTPRCIDCQERIERGELDAAA